MDETWLLCSKALAADDDGHSLEEAACAKEPKVTPNEVTAHVNAIPAAVAVHIKMQVGSLPNAYAVAGKQAD